MSAPDDKCPTELPLSYRVDHLMKRVEALEDEAEDAARAWVGVLVIDDSYFGTRLFGPTASAVIDCFERKLGYGKDCRRVILAHQSWPDYAHLAGRP